MTKSLAPVAVAVSLLVCLAYSADAHIADIIQERTFVSRLKVLSGERWYGGAVNLGAQQPWTDKSETFNIDYDKRDYDLSSDCWGGGVMPFLVSDKGRYIWSDFPFKFRFSKGMICIESNNERVVVTVAGTTLRQA